MKSFRVKTVGICPGVPKFSIEMPVPAMSVIGQPSYSPPENPFVGQQTARAPIRSGMANFIFIRCKQVWYVGGSLCFICPFVEAREQNRPWSTRWTATVALRKPTGRNAAFANRLFRHTTSIRPLLLKIRSGVTKILKFLRGPAQTVGLSEKLPLRKPKGASAS
jgi:hypothetical protein